MKHCLLSAVVAIASVFAIAFSAGATDTLSLSPGALAANPHAMKSVTGAALKVEGVADVRDLRVLADSLPATVKDLDLSALYIEQYTFPAHSDASSGFFPPQTIPPYIFAFSALTSISLPAELQAIGEGAFSNSKLETVRSGKNIVKIGDFAFTGCGALRECDFAAALSVIGTGAFEGCVSLLKADLAQTALTRIADRAFVGCKALAEICLPDRRLTIGAEAFTGTDVASIDVSYDNVPAPYAFASMQKLRKASLHGGTNSEGEFFNDAVLDSIGGAWHTLPPLFAAGSASVANPELLLYVDSIKQRALAGIAADSLVLCKNLVYVGSSVLAGTPALHIIDASRLEDYIPFAETDAFEGISQPDITLLVVDKYIDLWRQTPVWNRFRIVGVEENGIDDIMADNNAGIRYSLAGAALTIYSASPLRQAWIYSVDGRLLHNSAAQSSTVTIDLSPYSGTVVVARAVESEGKEKTVKILIP